MISIHIVYMVGQLLDLGNSEQTWALIISTTLRTGPTVRVSQTLPLKPKNFPSLSWENKPAISLIIRDQDHLSPYSISWKNGNPFWFFDFASSVLFPKNYGKTEDSFKFCVCQFSLFRTIPTTQIGWRRVILLKLFQILIVLAYSGFLATKWD